MMLYQRVLLDHSPLVAVVMNDEGGTNGPTD